MTKSLYDTDFHAWTQQQAAALRAKAWEQLDIEHVAEEIEGLCKSARLDLVMLLLAFLELIYRPCPHDNGRYYWQSAVIDHHRGMLESSLEDSPRWRPVVEAMLPDAYVRARQRLLSRRHPPEREPPEACPWTLTQLLDDRWWPSNAPARLP